MVRKIWRVNKVNEGWISFRKQKHDQSVIRVSGCLVRGQPLISYLVFKQGMDTKKKEWIQSRNEVLVGRMKNKKVRQRKNEKT